MQSISDVHKKKPGHDDCPSGQTFLSRESVKTQPFLSPPDAFIFTATRIYKPAYRLRDKKYQISERAFNETLRREMNNVAGAGSYGEYGEPNYWKQSKNELKRMASKYDEVRRVVDNEEVQKVTGICGSSGTFVRVIVWTKHAELSFEIGRSYALLGFDVKKKGSFVELTSTYVSTSIPLNDSQFAAPAAPCNNVTQILTAAKSCNAHIETDFVAKVISIRPYKPATGQSIIVRDVDGDEIKIKFVYGLETEGVLPIIEPGCVIAFTGLIIHHPITNLHRYLFTDEYTEFFTSSPIPAHLEADFRKLMLSK